MATCRLPYEQCCQRFFYASPYEKRTVARGLRQDMRRWLDERMVEDWDYELAIGDILFHFETVGQAAWFKLTWCDVPSILRDEPAPRPGGDIDY